MKEILKGFTRCRFIILCNPTAVSSQRNIVNLLTASEVLDNLKMHVNACKNTVERDNKIELVNQICLIE